MRTVHAYIGRKRRRNNGTVLIDLLLTIMIVLILIPVIMIILNVLCGTLHFDQDVQDMIASHQLRKILLISYDKVIEGDALYFTYQEKSMKLSEVNGNLIIQPGTQIFHTDISDVSFSEIQNVIYLRYEREGKEYEEAITNCQ